MIIRNSAKCRKCGDEIQSRHRHDLVYCSCQNLFVDGGTAYLRRGFEEVGTVEETSIIVDDDPADDFYTLEVLPDE